MQGQSDWGSLCSCLNGQCLHSHPFSGSGRPYTEDQVRACKLILESAKESHYKVSRSFLFSVREWNFHKGISVREWIFNKGISVRECFCRKGIVR